MTRFRLTRTLPLHATAAALRSDVFHGLSQIPKQLPPKWFYDARGSELFERITQELPAYYVSRAESALVAARAGDIGAATGGARTLIELGSGAASQKTRHLLDGLPDLHTYIPVDVSESALREAGEALTSERPQLNVHGLIADFTQQLALPTAPGPRLIALLGGTIGNLEPPERAAFYALMRSLMEPGDSFLLGVDLVKDEPVMVAAYADDELTGQFNRNVLAVINQQLNGDFDLGAFEHVALWDAGHERIEMRLRSRTAQTVKIRDLDLVVHFEQGEDLRTEVSAKFRIAGLASELRDAGLHLARWFSTPAQLTGLALATPAPGTPSSTAPAGRSTACVR
ncbi:L-histidine N(alpha)-methyltransferase [Streptomyces sp. NPDC004579]|uniref:L-histidine N(alpha)-methyltransferase n=1 Tax=Streptomyces sp. NPDC004579 TaxID=3154667 RepID=UPI0033B89511